MLSPFFFFAELEVELSTSYLLDIFSTTWTTLPALYALVIFEVGSYFRLGLAWTMTLLCVTPCIARMTGTGPLTQPDGHELQSSNLFLLSS
jgi:hypothetical protein